MEGTNVTPEVIADLYQDVLCKSYCSVASQTRIAEMMQAEPGLTATGALRKYIIEAIRKNDELGLLNIPPHMLQAVIDDLQQGEYRSRNLKRIAQRYRYDAGLTGRLTSTIKATLSHDRVRAFKNLAALRKVAMGTLATHILIDWIDRHKNEITEAKVNG